MKTRLSIYALFAMTFVFASLASTFAIAQSASAVNSNASAGDPFWDYTSLSIISEEGVSLVVTDDVLAAQVEAVPGSDVPDFGYFAYAVPSLDRQYLRLVEGNIVPFHQTNVFNRGWVTLVVLPFTAFAPNDWRRP